MEIRNRINEIFADNNSKTTLVVLKGFDMETCGYHRTDLSELIDDKFRAFMELNSGNEKVIAYEEFLVLYQFIISQYKKIVVLENGEYENVYPVNVNIESDMEKSLIAHFDEEAEEDSRLVEADKMNEYLNIFSNFFRLGDRIFCRYNTVFFEIEDDKILVVRIGSPAVEQQKIKSGYNYKDYKTYPEISGYMKKYWGYSDFRDLRIYDMEALDAGRKQVISVSQGKIIDDMIRQAEHCVNHEDARDIFVTAPTGAGKSLMFQLPAMYLAEKYKLLTIVITPLIGLMNDQVRALNDRGYDGARTINSDISPLVKEEILNEVAEGKCNILYLSPESLLAKAEVSQLIGSRRIGMIIVDEAHIVTTWGKQFRPDYWYLGDHVNKLRTTQGKADENPMSFVIATFTATAIYGGNEDMYTETINSLHMIDPITYLGYLKRDNISIDISEVTTVRNKNEYELDKFEALTKMITKHLMKGDKILIYFPTVKLIERFYNYCYAQNLSKYVARYHGQMEAGNKQENFLAFLTGDKKVMIATKAFGMGIDIPDIAVVAHFAPTGNVCDYMQEIGRAARDISIDGHAIYRHMKNDFKHINRLHGLSQLYPGQLIEVQKKILEVYEQKRYSDPSSAFCKKRNEILIDTDSFAYIFDSPLTDDNDLMNKVKTALLLIQKDYENRGFTPFRIRPIPLFKYGYFKMLPVVQDQLNRSFGTETVVEENCVKHICRVDLNRIWEKAYKKYMSYPNFKYLLYSHSTELDFNNRYPFNSAMRVDVRLDGDAATIYSKIIEAVKSAINHSVRNNIYISQQEMAEKIATKAGINNFKAENITRVILAAIAQYSETIARELNCRIYDTRIQGDNTVSYRFYAASRNFTFFIEKGYREILTETRDGVMYVVNEGIGNKIRESMTILGILEAFGVLRFKTLGGSNSQLYIYVNETKTMRIIREKPWLYKNRLLELIGERHREAVNRLTYLFENNMTSDEIWEYLEDYFLGLN